MDQYTAGVSSGFSATVFSLGGTSYFAIRGTDGPLDVIVSDIIGIGALGSARDQAGEMYRYWRRLTTPAGEPVAWSNAELNFLAGLAMPSLAPAGGLLAALEDRGLGVLGADAKVVVTGHSLGGHLAQLFYTMFPASVSEVFTFNSAGVGGIASELAARLLPSSGLGADVAVPAITNVIAKHGFNLTAGFGAQFGETARVFNEESALPPLNHSIGRLTDSLALYDLFAKLDSGVSLDSVTAILDAASNVPSQSLRAVTARLAELASRQPWGAGVTTVLGDGREGYFAGVLQIGALLDAAVSAPGYTVRSLAGMDAAALASLARGASAAAAYRYALQTLSPFALLGADTASPAAGLDLSLYDERTGQGALSGRWLADRAEYLAALLERNTWDHRGALRLPAQRGETEFASTDAAGASSVLRLASTLPVAPGAAARRIAFGAGGDERLEGGSGDDRLYGAAGADTLLAGEGNDYLEGGSGADAMSGGAGDDTLAGGEGADTLEGGAGRDRLEGGTGADLYRYSSGEGLDTIRDLDGQGAIVRDGVALTGGERAERGRWWNADHSVYYALAGDPAQRGTLNINGELAVRDFRNGDLGITLASAAPGEPPDAAASLVYLEGPYLRDDEGHLTWEDAYGSAGDDFYAGADDVPPRFFGKAGDDIVEGGGAASRAQAYLAGGSGDDLISLSATGLGNSADPQMRHFAIGGSGNDWIEGSPEADQIYGDLWRIHLQERSAGDFRLLIDWMDVRRGETGEVAGSQFDHAPVNAIPYRYTDVAEALSAYLGIGADSDLAASYDDTIDAGAGDDLVVGGAGSDLISGGEGDDRLEGDGSPVSRFGREFTAGELASIRAMLALRGEDVLDGGPGDDTLIGGLGDTLIGGPGDDRFYVQDDLFYPGRAAAGEDDQDAEYAEDESDADPANGVTILGGDGDDIISAGAPFALIDAGSGDDTVTVWAGTHASVAGGAGDDDITIWSGDADLDGGAGSDIYRITTFGHTAIDDRDADTGNVDRIVISDAGWSGLFGFSEDTVRFAQDGPDLVIEGDPYRIPEGHRSTPHAFETWTGPVEVPPQDLPAFVAANADPGSARLFSLTIRNWFAGEEYRVEEIAFGADGTAMSAAAIDAEMGRRALAARSEPLEVTGGDEADIIVGANGGDALAGGAGDDVLIGADGADVLSGGPGSDTLDGGEGDDVYRFDAGGGSDTIADRSITAAPNAIEFGPGIARESIALRPGVLQIGPREAGDEVVLSGFDHDDPSGSSAVAELRFDDGSRLAWAELIADGFTVPGTDGDDLLLGTALEDHIEGGEGNDQFFGGDASDTYVFAPGWGNDLVIDWGGDADAVRFGEGIGPEDVTVSRDAGRIVLADGADRVAIDWAPESGVAIERVVFASGEQWDRAGLEARALPEADPLEAQADGTSATVEETFTAAEPEAARDATSAETSEDPSTLGSDGESGSEAASEMPGDAETEGAGQLADEAEPESAGESAAEAEPESAGESAAEAEPETAGDVADVPTGAALMESPGDEGPRPPVEDDAVGEAASEAAQNEPAPAEGDIAVGPGLGETGSGAEAESVAPADASVLDHTETAASAEVPAVVPAPIASDDGPLAPEPNAIAAAAEEDDQEGTPDAQSVAAVPGGASSADGDIASAQSSDGQPDTPEPIASEDSAAAAEATVIAADEATPPGADPEPAVTPEAGSAGEAAVAAAVTPEGPPAAEADSGSAGTSSTVANDESAATHEEAEPPAGGADAESDAVVAAVENPSGAAPAIDDPSAAAGAPLDAGPESEETPVAQQVASDTSVSATGATSAPGGEIAVAEQEAAAPAAERPSGPERADESAGDLESETPEALAAAGAPAPVADGAVEDVGSGTAPAEAMPASSDLAGDAAAVDTDSGSDTGQVAESSESASLSDASDATVLEPIASEDSAAAAEATVIAADEATPPVADPEPPATPETGAAGEAAVAATATSEDQPTGDGNTGNAAALDPPEAPPGETDAESEVAAGAAGDPSESAPAGGETASAVPAQEPDAEPGAAPAIADARDDTAAAEQTAITGSPVSPEAIASDAIDVAQAALPEEPPAGGAGAGAAPADHPAIVPDSGASPTADPGETRAGESGNPSAATDTSAESMPVSGAGEGTLPPAQPSADGPIDPSGAESAHATSTDDATGETAAAGAPTEAVAVANEPAAEPAPEESGSGAELNPGEATDTDVQPVEATGASAPDATEAAAGQEAPAVVAESGAVAGATPAPEVTASDSLAAGDGIGPDPAVVAEQVQAQSAPTDAATSGAPLAGAQQSAPDDAGAAVAAPAQPATASGEAESAGNAAAEDSAATSTEVVALPAEAAGATAGAPAAAPTDQAAPTAPAESVATAPEPSDSPLDPAGAVDPIGISEPNPGEPAAAEANAGALAAESDGVVPVEAAGESPLPAEASEESDTAADAPVNAVAAPEEQASESAGRTMVLTARTAEAALAAEGYPLAPPPSPRLAAAASASSAALDAHAQQLAHWQQELRSDIDAFFARIAPAPLSRQEWLDTWFPAGLRPGTGRESATRAEGAATGEPGVSAEAPDLHPAAQGDRHSAVDDPAPPGADPAADPQSEIARANAGVQEWLERNPGFGDAAPDGVPLTASLFVSQHWSAVGASPFGAIGGGAGFADLGAGSFRPLEGVREGIDVLGMR